MSDSNVKTFKVGNITVQIERAKCISCGTCTSLASNTFELDSEMISQIKSEGPYDDETTIKQAAEGCAAEAITILDENGNKLWPKS